ncbi:hypothetical protein like AT2G26030 [Hibiscus trionum]|uniref:F-box domain-containing protein n=1 Tax=Hibiscus trionum TaxID=183268 RepID=A0A9W7I186_HIBTR|nr:hypothetical protein like AT2G26030 [Hibiscus trionum]
MAKQAKYHGSLDSLPDSILCHILSFLPTKDAVRTSILSPRWRYLFTSSISKLDSEDCQWYLLERKEHFKKFVDRLFFNPKHVRLECFRFRVNYPLLDDDLLSVYNWLCAALWRGVEEIDVCLHHIGILKLPTLLFTCPSLVKLKLFIMDWEMKVPTNVCLPNLRTLHLTDLKIVDGCSYNRLISGCPMLEDLDLSDCSIDSIRELNIHSLSLKRLVLYFNTLVNSTYDGDDFDHTLVIDAPSLIYFKYHCRVARGYTLNMESLETADITIFHYDEANRERSAALLHGICNVRVLRLSIIDSDAPVFRMPLDPVLTFNNLLELEFDNPYEDKMVSVTWTVEFLHSVPNMKTFTLNLGEADIELETLPEEVPSCLLYHLKEISITHDRGDAHMFEIASYFLKHALVLEKLAVRSVFALLESSIIEKLSSFPMKSRKCKIEIN